MEIIPANCIQILPFLSEPISSWSDKTDLLSFLLCLYDKAGSMMDSAGQVTTFNYSSYGKHLFDVSIKRYQSICSDFENQAKQVNPAPAAKNQAETIPDFSQDSFFGLMAKYAIAWDGTISEVLSESAFFCLAHVLEAQSDLDCSILLASKLYYKQALQVLRSFLEEVIMELYFCTNQSDLQAWKLGNYRVPPLRGKNGVLSILFSKSLLTEDLADQISALYGDLNSSIHGAETQLINRGVFQGTWAGMIFKYDRYRDWCNYFSRCVEVGLKILRVTVNLWENTRPIDSLQCDVCHNEDFDIEKNAFAGIPQTTLKCRICGSNRTYDSIYIAKWGY
ncbi:hypothetical protein H6G04_18380 [Calothrix membranacea FACHB-236]|nr:hypothetical protein [Calothrix membranacea FACHB-236]